MKVSSNLKTSNVKCYGVCEKVPNATTQTHVTFIPGSATKQFVTHTAHLLKFLSSVMILSAANDLKM